MVDYKSPEFQTAWLKIIARAVFDENFKNSLMQDPSVAFKEYGLNVDKGIDLNKDVSPRFDEAIESIRQQQAQSAAVNSGSGSTGSSYNTSSGSGVRNVGDQACASTTVCFCNGSASRATSIPCWGSASVSGASSQLPGGMPAPVRSDMSMNSPNFSSAGSAGTLGTFCGCGGTLGSFGCYGLGGTTGSTATYGSANMGGASSQLPGAFPSRTSDMTNSPNFSSAGSAGTLGTFCGCGGTLGSFGCYGLGGTTGSTATYGSANVGGSSSQLSSGATQGSVATFCNTVGSYVGAYF